ncbi:MAG: 4-hydroxy-tetrahydrodipicolinate synthase [Crocinitomicaceae bacterium]
MENMFKGVGVALVTPFNSDKSIDFKGLKRLVQLQIEGGTDYLVVQGTTGESPVLSLEEKKQILQTVIDENNGKLKIVYGLGGNNTMAVGELFKQIPSGVDGILSVSPFYNKPTQKGIIDHFKYLASCTRLPIILYNVPGRTSSNMAVETILELAKINNIVAIKEASGNIEQITDLLRLRPEGFGIISGDDPITYPMITMGADGVISVVANALPELFNDMVHLAMKGDLNNALQIHFDLIQVTKYFFQEGNPSGVKEALKLRGVCEKNLRLPLVEVSSELSGKIKSEVTRLTN